MTEIRGLFAECSCASGCPLCYFGPCLFCGEVFEIGAFWSGTVNVAFCADCILAGKLGLLIGDAIQRASSIEKALLRTGREAWRARVLASERNSAQRRV